MSASPACSLRPGMRARYRPRRYVMFRMSVDKSARTMRGEPTTWRRNMMTLRSCLTAGLVAAVAATSHAEEIAVGNYGVSANGMPFGVALV